MQIRQYVSEKKDAVLQNLQDADCPQEVIRQFMRSAEEDRENQATAGSGKAQKDIA